MCKITHYNLNMTECTTFTEERCPSIQFFPSPMYDGFSKCQNSVCFLFSIIRSTKMASQITWLIEERCTFLSDLTIFVQWTIKQAKNTLKMALKIYI